MSDLAWLESFHGFLLVDKPAGITSQDVITRLQHALMKRSGGKLKKRALPSMGHGGTLDPFATGLLVVAVGDGVKLTRYLLGSDKSYEAEVAFGARTASGDLTNEVIARTDRLPSDRTELERAARSFLDGPYLQTPPMYSAKKIDGVPLYEMARKGLEVERAAIACSVREFEIMDARENPRLAEESGRDTRHVTNLNPLYTPGGISSATIRTRVTAGTFIRTLAEDFAERTGSLAYLTSLRRLASGSIRLENALTLDALSAALEEGRAWSELPCFTPFHRAILGILPQMEIEVPVAVRIFSGEVKTLGELKLPAGGSTALYACDRLVAIVREADPSSNTPRRIERGFPLRFDDLVP